MSTTASRSADVCAVCGKDTIGQREFMRLYVEGRPVQLCCPLCLDIFQRDRIASHAASARRACWRI